MKKIVWKNKSNNQLCVTIPQKSGIKEGDVVSIEKQKIHTIVYSSVTGDLFHYGHLRILEQANEEGEFHICGVLTDLAIKAYKSNPVAKYRERSAIISSLRCVDMVMKQEDLDPTENLKKIREQFGDVHIKVIYGSNWKKVPGENYIKKIGGEIIQPEFYDALSKDKILEKLSGGKK